MRKLVLCICLMAATGTSIGKTVDITTARGVAYQFLKSKVSLQSSADLSLAYSASSEINGNAVTDFYIFNSVASTGFVIVSADDLVRPILGYSTESAFATTRISPEVQFLLEKYQKQVAYVIQNNISTALINISRWNVLINGAGSVERTTMDSLVYPMILTQWDQDNETGSTPTYNADCPFDANASPAAQTVTGCVATAMAQVMKYWNWPDTGVGSHSYTQYPNSDYLPSLSANFEVPFYFDSMPRRIVSSNTHIAQLMYFAGVSVNMHYGTASEGGSGAFVTSGYSPVQNCAEYALKTYFKYPTATGYQRNSFSQEAWMDSMMNEMSSGRPVVYAGSGTGGGHCWVMDGFDNDTFFHFNFGWSDLYNGFYTLDNIAPPIGESFNDNEEAITHIIPDTPVHSNAVQQVASLKSEVSLYPNPTNGNVTVVATQALGSVRISDMTGRAIREYQPEAGVKNITLTLGDLPDGVYLVSVQTGESTIISKLVLTR